MAQRSALRNVEVRRGREEVLALGMVLIILAVPLLLYAVTHLRR